MRDIAEVMGVLKEIRKRKDLTVADVADYMQKETGNKVSTKTIYGWEEGNSKPDIMCFVVMCNLYEVSDIMGLFTGETQSIDTVLRDKLYISYLSKPDMQEAARILLGIK